MSLLIAGTVEWALALLYLILSTALVGNLATYLRDQLHWDDGFSRKLNHVGIMVLSGVFLPFLPEERRIPSIAVASSAMMVLYAISAYSTTPVIRGIVAGSLRRRDEPHSRFFFFFPLISFNITLLVAALIFPQDVVLAAFFTVALADGFAEPIGVYFGRNNSYLVRDVLWGTCNKKSVAGSSSVLLLALGIALVAFAHDRPFDVGAVCAAVAYACAITLIEASSPRGTDNMLLMLIGPALLFGLKCLLP